MERLLMPLADDRERKSFEKAGNLDIAHEIEGLARFRVNLLRQHNGMGAVFRVIPSRIPTVEELNLPPVLKTLAASKRGIIIVTGPTGSGKSTTMAAMINYINQTRHGHIITIEDPIEFTHSSQNCLIDHRQVGHHTRSFAEALKAALREDPDIVLVGEMRDLETIALAITAAEMGVLVFGTLHTNSAAKTIDRIIDVFPSKQQEQVRSQLSQSLKGVVAQQLLKTADGQGRCAAVEVLICNLGLSNLIREGKTNQIGSFIQMGKDEGMISMDDALYALVESGKITPQMAFTRSIEKERMKGRLGIRA
jgi:twitching motility protein PilT